MTEEKMSLLISIFREKQLMDQAVQQIQSLHKDNVGILAAVAIDKEVNGKISYKDIGMSPTKGALSGLVLGAVVGVLTGGIGLVLGGAGALIGGLVGSKKYQERFSEVRLHEVVAALKPGETTIAVVAEPDALKELEKAMTALDAEYFTTGLSADLAEELEKSKLHPDHDKWLDEIDKS